MAQVQGLTHRYKRITALDDVTLSIPAGCMVGLIGPDGVGKSTLLALLAGSKRIQDGQVQVLDGDVLMGVISFLDVAKAVLEEQGFENAMLKNYIKNWPGESEK